MNVFVIGLTIFLIISLLIDAYFHYKHAQLLQKDWTLI